MFDHRPTPCKRNLLWLGLIFLFNTTLASEVGRTADKLDESLVSFQDSQPVFVRMEDQLLKQAGDYAAFCLENDLKPRSEVRKQVLQTLKTKAEDSWARIKDKLSALEAKGQVKEMARFWIVNGFACEATSAACRALAEDPAVSFVYKQLGPKNLRQHGPATRMQGGGAMSAVEQKAALEQLLKHSSDDSGEPFNTNGLEIPWNLSRIQADLVWEKEGVTGKGAVVAINDGGIVDIPALWPALWRNSSEQMNDRDDDGNGFMDDVLGHDFESQSNFVLDPGSMNHGTICAGIIAGRPVPGNALVTGVAPRAKLMILKGMGYLKAYEYALSNGADVFSMSYMWVNMDLGQYRGVFRAAAEHLSVAGILPVGGAGNFAKTAPEGKQICLPKDIPCVVAVAGILEDGRRPEFSSKGPCTWTGVRFYDDYPATKPLCKPDLCAPAGGFPCWTKMIPNQSQAQWTVLWSQGILVNGPQGNSFAGPHAAGVAALIFSANPELNAWQVKRIMEETSKRLESTAPDYQHGAGLLQALAAVRAARKAK